MDELKQLREVAHRVDEALFARSRAGYYLLGLYPSAPDSPVAAASRPSFATSPAISVDEMMSLLNSGAEAEAEPALAGRFLRVVKKSSRNPFRGRISVGRAANNDVVITHPSVSKLHAHLFVQPGVHPDGGDELRVADVGSRNGTRVDDRPVDVDEPVALRTGSRVRFGDVVCTVLDAAALHRTMRSLFPIRG
jgi:hypothetical protein